MKLSVNTGFLVNRYPTPSQWGKIIGDLNVKHIQLTADLFSPYYQDEILEKWVEEIKEQSIKYNFSVTSVFTGGFTRVNHFCHPDESVRNYWLSWFKRFSLYASKLGAIRVGSHIGIMSIPDDKQNRNLYQTRCIDMWKELAKYSSEYGIKELTWEHMSISREQGHTREDIDFLVKSFEETTIPIKICLDPDHGDLTSFDSKDYEPYGLLKKYLPFSSQLHLKQTSKDKRTNGSFTPERNLTGLIEAPKVINLLKKYVPDKAKDNFELILELNARERDPDDSKICEDVLTSLDYWRSNLEQYQIPYE